MVIPLNGIRIFYVISDQFFHPDHVIPSAEFPSAFPENAHALIPDVAVEITAVVCKISVFI